MASRPGVFLLQDDDKTLVPMGAVAFAAEVDFQALLSRHPALLVGDQIDPGPPPRRFMLVKQEQSIGHDVDPSRWSVDHLFLDQDGVPTLVEVKRKSDTRLRREVVGQMLDYASNCQAHWTADGMRESLEATCAAMGASSADTLERLLEPGISPEALWSNVQRNLQAGKIRMLFVADEIPTELRRIVEFLNEQMDPAEILAIELRQFAGQSYGRSFRSSTVRRRERGPRRLPRRVPSGPKSDSWKGSTASLPRPKERPRVRCSPG